jgi:hypothetical protein
MVPAPWKFSVLSVVFASTLALSARPAIAQERAPTTLPLRAARLYEVGLGYFERTGRLGKAADLSLPVPASHLDDALKTLVVLGDGGKTNVAGIEFASSVSPAMGRALAGLPEGDSAITYSKLLKSLQGASVELKTERESLRGRLVDIVEPADTEAECAPNDPAPTGAAAKSAAAPCVMIRPMTLLLLTERGEIRRLRLTDVASVRPLDPGLAARMGSGLDANSTQGASNQKKLRVLATSSSDITLGYVAETPVWRSSYRLVLDNHEGGTLQGWALVHNDTDEDWKQVRVELVNGQPTSFLFPLAAPRYARREMVTPEVELSTVPQLLGRTVDTMWGNSIGESFGAGGLGLTGVGEGGGGRGEGIGLGTIGAIGAIGHGAGSAQASTALSVGNLASIAPAVGVESGVQFRYVLPSPIDLRAHGSALVPFLQRAISARRIAHFTHPGAAAKSAVRIKNTTGQTLPAGTIASFADGGFAGEATLDRMTPDEHRIMAFGVDLDVELTAAGSSQRDEARLIVFENDALVEHYVRVRDVEHTIINKSSSGRAVFLTLDYVLNSRVVGADELDFDTIAGKALAVFSVGAKTQVTRKLHVEEGLSRRHLISGLTSRRLAALAAETKLHPDQRGLLRAAAERMREAEEKRDAIPKVEAATADAEEDLKRLRAHLSAARQGGGDAEPFVERILAAEDRRSSLRQRAALLASEREARVAAALKALSRLKGPLNLRLTQ